MRPHLRFIEIIGFFACGGFPNSVYVRAIFGLSAMRPPACVGCFLVIAPPLNLDLIPLCESLREAGVSVRIEAQAQAAILARSEKIQDGISHRAPLLRAQEREPPQHIIVRGQAASLQPRHLKELAKGERGDAGQPSDGRLELSRGPQHERQRAERSGRDGRGRAYRFVLHGGISPALRHRSARVTRPSFHTGLGPRGMGACAARFIQP